MSRGRRYDTEAKLNIKKVIAVILVILVIIMFIVGIRKLLTTSSNEVVTKVTSYFPVYTNEKWGVIDNTGKIVITPEYTEMITIPDSKTDLFIITYDVNYQDNTYKTKVLNSKNEEKFTNYDLVEAIENIDKNNNLWYEEGVLKVKKQDKYGLIDYTGREILKTEYTSIQALTEVQNSLIIKDGEKVGLCDNKGNIIITPEYKEIKGIGNDYKNGYIVVNNSNKYGLIDFTKNIILEPVYEEIKQVSSTSIFIVKEDGKLKAINKNKETILENKFEDVSEINTDNIIYIKNQKYGIINTNGETKISEQYQDLQYTFGNYYIAKKENKYGIVDIENKEALPFEYSNITYQKEAGIIIASKENEENQKILNDKLENKLEGIVVEINNEKTYIKMRVEDKYKYYNFKLEEIRPWEALTQNTIFLDKKDGKYGYIDKEGNKVIDYIYEDGTEQNNFGYAGVKKDGKWMAIDKEGKVVQEKGYTLENNIIIDFIEKWHLAEDINSYYYTDV